MNSSVDDLGRIGLDMDGIVCATCSRRADLKMNFFFISIKIGRVTVAEGPGWEIGRRQRASERPMVVLGGVTGIGGGGGRMDARCS